ncbi:MAG TPA: NADH-quinone oxidoreductase subunit N [Acidobacteriaceae bacterium]|jgi:NADH-quinone oxidoreductase subunit N
MSPNLLSLLPELVLTVVAVIIMLIEPTLGAGTSRKPLGWLAIFGTALSAFAATVQLNWVNAHGTLTGFYGTIQIDAFSVFFHLLIAVIVLVVILASLDYFEGPVTHAGEYYALALFGATGMMFMTCSVELLMVFIGLEISSISTYILAGFRKGQATASESSLKYFLLGSFATAFFLYGISLCFGATGSTTIGAIAAHIGTSTSPTLGILAVAMVLIGLGFKVSLAPFHVWTPDVYQGAPAPVVGLMSTAPKAAAFAVLLRFLFNATPGLRPHWIVMIEILAVLSMTIGNLGALLQRDVKRLLAYSSIAHAGYLLVAFTSFQQDAVAGALFYSAAYAAMNVGAFLVLTQLTGYGEQARSIDDFTGLALQRPGLSALLGFFLLSLIGIPFTGGFFGKFYAFSAAIHGGHVWLAIIGLANSGVACFYYLRLLAALYTRPVVATEAAPTRRLTFSAATALAATGVATLALGIFPGKLLHLVQRATPETVPVVAGPVMPVAAAAVTPVSSVE